MQVSYRKRTDLKVPKWEYTIRHDGKRYRKSGFKTKSDAISGAKSFYENLINLDVTHHDMKFKDYYLRWVDLNKKNELSRNQYRWYELSLQYFLDYFGDNIKLNKISRSNYQAFLNDYGNGRADESVRKVNGCIQQVFRDAVYEKLMSSDPSYKIITKGTKDAQQEEDKYMKLNDYLRLIEYLKNKKEKSYIVLLLLSLTGGRFNEVNQMQYDDVFKHHDEVHMVGTKTKNADRNVSLNRDDLNHVRNLINLHPRRVDNKLFDLSYNAIKKSLNHALNELEIDYYVTTKTLRHTHCSYLLSKQVPIEYISKRLGHSSIKITLEVYSHLLDEYKDEQDIYIRKIFG